MQSSKDQFDLFKEKGEKARNLLIKVFARSNAEHSQKREQQLVQDPKIRATKNTKTFRKSTGSGKTEEKVKEEETTLVERVEVPLPIPGNETILEGSLNLHRNNKV